MRNTNCEKCLFADTAISNDPCKMNIIDKIKDQKTIVVENDFYRILDYKCKYGFEIETYKKNKEIIGSIENLKNTIKINNYIKYTLIIDLKDFSKEHIVKVCDTINSMSIIPSFVCFFVVENNETGFIIDSIKNAILPQIQWKLNNFLFTQETKDYISSIISTNSKKNNSFYFWINNSTSCNKLSEEIATISRIINIDQPKTQALIRNKLSWDGIFLSFDNYQEMVLKLGIDIIDTLDKLENKNLIDYD